MAFPEWLNIPRHDSLVFTEQPAVIKKPADFEVWQQFAIKMLQSQWLNGQSAAEAVAETLRIMGIAEEEIPGRAAILSGQLVSDSSLIRCCAETVRIQKNGNDLALKVGKRRPTQIQGLVIVSAGEWIPSPPLAEHSQSPGPVQTTVIKPVLGVAIPTGIIFGTDEESVAGFIFNELSFRLQQYSARAVRIKGHVETWFAPHPDSQARYEEFYARNLFVKSQTW